MTMEIREIGDEGRKIKLGIVTVISNKSLNWSVVSRNQMEGIDGGWEGERGSRIYQPQKMIKKGRRDK